MKEFRPHPALWIGVSNLRGVRALQNLGKTTVSVSPVIPCLILIPMNMSQNVQLHPAVVSPASTEELGHIFTDTTSWYEKTDQIKVMSSDRTKWFQHILLLGAPGETWIIGRQINWNISPENCISFGTTKPRISVEYTGNIDKASHSRYLLRESMSAFYGAMRIVDNQSWQRKRRSEGTLAHSDLSLRWANFLCCRFPTAQ